MVSGPLTLLSRENSSPTCLLKTLHSCARFRKLEDSDTVKYVARPLSGSNECKYESNSLLGHDHVNAFSTGLLLTGRKNTRINPCTIYVDMKAVLIWAVKRYELDGRDMSSNSKKGRKKFLDEFHLYQLKGQPRPLLMNSGGNGSIKKIPKLEKLNLTALKFLYFVRRSYARAGRRTESRKTFAVRTANRSRCRRGMNGGLTAYCCIAVECLRNRSCCRRKR